MRFYPLALAVLLMAGVGEASAAVKREELFGLTNVWTIQLTFTREQWGALEPPGHDQTRLSSGMGPWLGREGGRNGLSAAYGIAFRYVKANLEFGGQNFTNIAVRYKGNGT